ncbi:hypothetical protein [Paenibacillus kyungheensis]
MENWLDKNKGIILGLIIALTVTIYVFFNLPFALEQTLYKMKALNFSVSILFN